MMEKWFNNNTVAKILALAVSILLWAMVHLDSGTTAPSLTTTYGTRTIDNVKIQTIGLDDSRYELTGMNTDRVRIQVKGQRSALTSFFGDDYNVSVDLSHMGEGTETLPLMKPDVPFGVEVVSMEPSMVTVTVEQKQTKAFNVKITPTGEAAEGMQIGAGVADPATANVTLPTSRMETVASVQGFVDVSKASSNVEDRKVKLKAYDKNGKEVEGAVIEPNTASVVVPISQAYKSLPIKVNYTGELPEGLVLSNVNPSVTEAAVYGTPDYLSKVQGSIQATLDLSKLQAQGTTAVQVPLTKPEGAGRINPESVELQVTVAPFGEVQDIRRTMTDIPVTLQGAASAEAASITEPQTRSLNIEVSGPENLVNNLTNDDIMLVADVTGLQPGDHSIPVQITLPRYITRPEGSQELMVTVNVQEASVPANTPEQTIPESSPDAENNQPVQGNSEAVPSTPNSAGHTGDTSGDSSTEEIPQDNTNINQP